MQFFDRAKQKVLARTRLPARERAEVSGKIICARCESSITEADARTAMRGSHEHRFTNPHGIEFRIGCFASAPGCRTTGEPSMEWTWFAGYTWQIENCAHCRAHLGWRFESPGHIFHGLILDRLTELEAPSPARN